MRSLFAQTLWSVFSAAAMIAGGLFAASAQASTFVYVGNAESNEIQVWQLNQQNGDLTLIETVPLTGVVKAGMSTPIAVSPNRRFLYVALRGEPQLVISFSIHQKTGKLTLLGTAPLVDSMAYIATDRTGRYLFAASYPGHKLTVSPINEKGIVQATQEVLPSHTNAHSILPDVNNRFVLAATLGNDQFNQFLFDAKTGKLTPHTPAFLAVKAKTGPRHFVFHPKGKQVYLLGELDASVHVFDFDPKGGILREKQALNGLPAGVTGRIAAADLQITPNGSFLYSSERTSSTITAFKVNPTDGTLTLIEHLPTEAQPRSFAIDRTGKYLFVAGQRSHRIAGYTIDQKTGRLQKMKDYAAGKNPSWVEIVTLP